MSRRGPLTPAMRAARCDMLLYGELAFTTSGWRNAVTGAVHQISTIDALAARGDVIIVKTFAAVRRPRLARLTAAGRERARAVLMREAEQLLAQMQDDGLSLEAAE